MIRDFRTCRRYIAADLYRYMTSTSVRAYLRGWFIPGFRYCVFLRTAQWMAFSRYRAIFFPLYLLVRLVLRHYQFKYGISIHYTCEVGPGLAIGHFGNIIVNPSARIGANCNISPGVLLGLDFDKVTNRFVYPTIGNRVSLGNGAKVLGGVEVSDDAMIGVLTVVTKNVPPKAIVVGNPNRILNYNGSAQFVGSFHPWTKTIS